MLYLFFLPMIKVFIRYLLSLCILFFSGYSLLSAHIYRQNAFNLSIDNKESKDLSFCTLQHDQEFVSKPSASSSGINSNNDKIIAPGKEEENKLSSWIDHLTSRDGTISFFYSGTSGFLYSCLQKSQIFYTYFTYSSSSSYYLIFRVFRIWFNLTSVGHFKLSDPSTGLFTSHNEFIVYKGWSYSSFHTPFKIISGKSIQYHYEKHSYSYKLVCSIV